MATANDIINVALAEEGVADNGNNLVKYNTEYYGKKVQGDIYLWCCVFIWWVFKHAGASILFYKGRKTASCTTLRDSMSGQRVKEPKRGDLVFFNWNKGHDKAHHIGIFLRKVDANFIETIDGNTGLENESNGGRVMRRIRSKAYVDCYIRPNYDPEPEESIKEEPVVEEPKQEEEFYIVKKGDNLSKIAKKYGTTWQELWRINNIEKPSLIYPGQKIRLK